MKCQNADAEMIKNCPVLVQMLTVRNMYCFHAIEYEVKRCLYWHMAYFQYLYVIYFD